MRKYRRHIYIVLFAIFLALLAVLSIYKEQQELAIETVKGLIVIFLEAIKEV